MLFSKGLNHETHACCFEGLFGHFHGWIFMLGLKFFITSQIFTHFLLHELLKICVTIRIMDCVVEFNDFCHWNHNKFLMFSEKFGNDFKTCNLINCKSGN